MPDIRPVLFVCGILLTTLAVAMLLPMVVDLAVGHPDWQVFLASSAITLFFGVAFMVTNWSGRFTFGMRQAFILTTLSWLLIAAFGSLPFAFCELDMSVTDAFFESMSGITTTGSTVIVGLDMAPPGILIWRALLQWLGGIGIIVMALSVLPMLRVGGMQLFRLESSDTSEKVLPRAAQIASAIGLIYLGLTVLCAFAYGAAGMPWFDAFAHAMTTIATGGFSTSDLSIGVYGSASIEAIATAFMLIGALPFVLYLRAIRGQPIALFRDSQVRWFLAIVALAILIMATYLWMIQDDLPATDALRLTSFNVVSMITGTGYATSDFGAWGKFAIPAFFFLMFVGGCAGSTTCGVKVFRIQVLFSFMKAQLAKLLHPHGVFIPYYNGKPIPDAVAESVMSFFFIWVAAFAILTLVLGLTGLDFLTSMSGAATAIANVGPGLGETIGPAETFRLIPDTAKWAMSAGMLLGRLELFTVLILFYPGFWRL